MTTTLPGNLPADLLVRLADDVRAGTVDPAATAAVLAQVTTAIAGVTEALVDALTGEWTAPASRLAAKASTDAVLSAGRLRALTATIDGHRL